MRLFRAIFIALILYVWIFVLIEVGVYFFVGVLLFCCCSGCFIVVVFDECDDDFIFVFWIDECMCFFVVYNDCDDVFWGVYFFFSKGCFASGSIVCCFEFDVSIFVYEVVFGLLKVVVVVLYAGLKECF